MTTEHTGSENDMYPPMTTTDMKAKAREAIKRRLGVDPNPELIGLWTEAHNAGMEEEYRREINVRDRAATSVLQQKGYRFCDIPACNCGSWHSPQLEETNEYKRGMEEAAKVVREKCTACNGTGGIGGGIHYVTRDMASDACEPSMEGQEIIEDPIECEYCGRPIAAIREKINE